MVHHFEGGKLATERTIIRVRYRPWFVVFVNLQVNIFESSFGGEEENGQYLNLN